MISPAVPVNPSTGHTRLPRSTLLWLSLTHAPPPAGPMLFCGSKMSLFVFLLFLGELVLPPSCSVLEFQSSKHCGIVEFRFSFDRYLHFLRFGPFTCMLLANILEFRSFIGLLTCTPMALSCWFVLAARWGYNPFASFYSFAASSLSQTDLRS